MNIERIAPMLTVDDLATAIAEHAGVLGMRVVMDMQWVAFLADEAGHQIGLMTTDATAPVNPNMSVFVDDVEAAYAAAVASGVEVVHPLTSEEWGVRRFFYRDSSGRVINVGTHVGDGQTLVDPAPELHGQPPGASEHTPSGCDDGC